MLRIKSRGYIKGLVPISGQKYVISTLVFSRQLASKIHNYLQIWYLRIWSTK